MATDRGDLLQGTLDMLVLKALQLEPMHGWGITERIEQCRRASFTSGRARSIPRYIGSSARVSFDRNGRPRRTIGAPAITR